MAERYLSVEAPDTVAKVDFLGKFGFTVKISTEEKNGKHFVNVSVAAEDDRNTVLGEIYEEIPKAYNPDEEAYERQDFENHVIEVCQDALVALVGEENVEVEDTQIAVTLEDGTKYTVELEETPVDAEDRGDGNTLDEIEPIIKKPESHAEILDVCLLAMKNSGRCREAIEDLTTDGDGNDCEAIFTVDETYYILKVR